MSEVVWAAGRPIVAVDDLVRRYCGLTWSGNPPEVWAYAYFDAVPTSGGSVEPVDVLACAALHPGLSQQNLAWFVEAKEAIDGTLARLPESTTLETADGKTLDALEALPELAAHGTPQSNNGVGMSLLTKVLHRKRPGLVPLLDRAVSDRYRFVTGRKGVAAWPPLVHALRSDLCNDVNRRVLHGVREQVAVELRSSVPSDLRLLDIAIWMDDRVGGQ
ncbi:MAG: DUF6308 family protein [Actinomycetota bacterium]|nr:DUF6308 family protein [Actinomycetota bacterium]